MNHSTLEIFIQVAETQSVTQAAKRLGRAQSNITTRIQQLEEELAVELFVRGNKKMVLSPAGVQFLSYARRILSLAEEAKQALHPTTPGGSLRLGAMEATAASRLPPLLTRFQQQCPQVDITLITQPTRQLTEGVLTAALDAALVCLPPGADGQPACPAELAFTPVFYETLMLVRPQTPGPLRFAAFASGCSYRALGERWLAEQQAAWEAQCAAMDAAGFLRVTAFNPYWEVNGVTFVDRDGYRTVLQNRAWGMVCDSSGIAAS